MVSHSRAPLDAIRLRAALSPSREEVAVRKSSVWRRGEDLSNTYLVAMSFSINLHHVNNLVATKVNI